MWFLFLAGFSHILNSQLCAKAWAKGHKPCSNIYCICKNVYIKSSKCVSCGECIVLNFVVCALWYECMCIVNDVIWLKLLKLKCKNEIKISWIRGTACCIRSLTPTMPTVPTTNEWACNVLRILTSHINSQNKRRKTRVRHAREQKKRRR